MREINRGLAEREIDVAESRSESGAPQLRNGLNLVPVAFWNNSRRDVGQTADPDGAVVGCRRSA